MVVVSIPTRFNYNLSIDNSGDRENVSIPTRFNYNQIKDDKGEVRYEVSIPTRFNYNDSARHGKRHAGVFQFQQGSIITRIRVKRTTSVIVSIPTRFNYNFT